MALADMMGYTVTQLPGEEEESTHPMSIVAPTTHVGPSMPAIAPMTPQAPPVEDHNLPGAESIHLFDAIDKGYADKKIVNPVETIRQGVQVGDMDMVGKGFVKLKEVLEGGRSFGERFGDAYFRNNEMTNSIHKMAADTVMRELLRPSVEGATQSGLLQPHELVPGAQANPAYAHLIPAESGGFTDEGMPLTSVRMSGVPAQPDQRPGGMSLVPGARLNDIQGQLVASRLEGMQKGKGQAPAGLQEFNTQVQAEVAAFVEKHGRPPTQQEFLPMIKSARGQYKEEPAPGSKSEEELIKQIENLDERTKQIKEQTQTEKETRQPNINNTKAQTTERLAIAHERLVAATGLAQRGLMADARLQLDQARAELVNAKGQIQALLIPLTEGKMSKDDIAKAFNMILELSGNSARVEHEISRIWPDFGLPDLKLDTTAAPRRDLSKGSQPPTPQGVVQPPPLSPHQTIGVNPADFAPRPGNLVPNVPAPIEQPVLTPGPPQTRSKLTPDMIAEYNRLRIQGLSKAQIAAEMEKKFPGK